MKKKLIPLINTGQNTEGEKSLPESWEVIENARLDGHPDHLRYIKRKGLEKKKNCPVDDVYIMDSYKENIFAIGAKNASIYNSTSNLWGDIINMKQEYAQKESIASFIEHDFQHRDFSHAESQIIEHNGYVYHYYVTNSGNIDRRYGGTRAFPIYHFQEYFNFGRYLDILDKDYNFIETIWFDPSEYKAKDIGKHCKTAELFIKDGYLHMLDMLDNPSNILSQDGWRYNKYFVGSKIRVYRFLQTGFTKDLEEIPEWSDQVQWKEGDVVLYEGNPYFYFGFSTSTNLPFDHPTYDFWIPYLKPYEVKSRARLWEHTYGWDPETNDFTDLTIRPKYKRGDVVRRLSCRDLSREDYIYVADSKRTFAYNNYAGDDSYSSIYPEEAKWSSSVSFGYGTDLVSNFKPAYMYFVCLRDCEAKIHYWDYPAILEPINGLPVYFEGSIRRYDDGVGNRKLYRVTPLNNNKSYSVQAGDTVASLEASGIIEEIDQNLIDFGFLQANSEIDDNWPTNFIPIVNYMEVRDDTREVNPVGSPTEGSVLNRRININGPAINGVVTKAFDPPLQRYDTLLGLAQVSSYHIADLAGVGEEQRGHVVFTVLKIPEVWNYYGINYTTFSEISQSSTVKNFSNTIQLNKDFNVGLFGTHFSEPGVLLGDLISKTENNIVTNITLAWIDLDFYRDNEIDEYNQQTEIKLVFSTYMQTPYEWKGVTHVYPQDDHLLIGYGYLNASKTAGESVYASGHLKTQYGKYGLGRNSMDHNWQTGTGASGYFKKVPITRVCHLENGSNKVWVTYSHVLFGGTNSFSIDFDDIGTPRKEEDEISYFGLYPLGKPFSIDNDSFMFCSTADYVGDGIYVVDRFFEDSTNRGDRTNNRCYLIRFNKKADSDLREATRTSDHNFGFPIYPVTTFGYGSDVPLAQYKGYNKEGKAVISYFVPQTTKRVNKQLYSIIEVDFNKILKPQAIEAFGSLIIAGNIIKEFDGSNLSENNFFQAPRIRPHLIPEGVSTHKYRYKAVYVHINKKGDSSVSRVSNTTQIFIQNPISPDNRVVMLVENCIMTSKKNVLIEIYRTEGAEVLNEFNEQYYRVGTMVSDPSSPFAYFEDKVEDADIKKASELFRYPILYNSGNVLENENIGGVSNMVVHNGRLFAQSNIDGTTFYSKQKSIGEAISFSIFLSIDTVGSTAGLESRGTVGSRGLYLGDIGALTSISGYLILMLENSIVAIAGDGADATGSNPSFTEPQVISDSQGCTEPQTIVNTPDGIVFKGRDSWYLLIQSLEIRNIGENISEYFDYIIRSSSLSIDKGLIYYFAQSQDGLDKIILVFDYKHGGRWYQYRTDIDGIVDSTTINGNIAIIKNTDIDNFYIQGDGYKDNGLDYSMKFRTGWLKLRMIQALKRISRLMVLGQLKSNDYTYKLTEYSDYLATNDQWASGVAYNEAQLIENGDNTYICLQNHTSGTFATDLSNGKWRIVSITKSSIPKGRQTDFHVSKQKSDSFKFELEVAPSGTGTGETIEIENISLLVGVSDKRQKTGINNKG